MGSPYGLDQARKRSVSATAPFERLESVMSEPWWMDFSAVSVAAGLPPVEEEELGCGAYAPLMGVGCCCGRSRRGRHSDPCGDGGGVVVTAGGVTILYPVGGLLR